MKKSNIVIILSNFLLVTSKIFPLISEIESEVDLFKAYSCQMIIEKKLEFLKNENIKQIISSDNNCLEMKLLCYNSITDKQVIKTITDIKNNYGVRMTKEEINNLTENKTGKKIEINEILLHNEKVERVFDQFDKGIDATKLTKYLYKKDNYVLVLIVTIQNILVKYGNNILHCIGIIFGIVIFKKLNDWRNVIKLSLTKYNVKSVNKKHNKKSKKH